MNRLPTKGIVLAGGANTRLYPVTLVVSKQLLPVYDKPMIYYPLSLLMLAGIRDILVISTPRDTANLARLLGDGADLGLKLSYLVQSKPEGIAQALVLGRDFLAGSPCALVLGDNILFGHGLGEILANVAGRQHGASVFGYQVQDPERYGVVEFDRGGRALSIEEKPKRPRSRWAVIGLYFYDGRASEAAGALKLSARGELEITDLNRWYLERGELTVEPLGRGFAWLDAGTFDSLQDAAEFVRVIQLRQGSRVACIEEIALRRGYIDRAQLRQLGERAATSEYGRYLLALAAGEE